MDIDSVENGLIRCILKTLGHSYRLGAITEKDRDARVDRTLYCFLGLLSWKCEFNII